MPILFPSRQPELRMRDRCALPQIETVVVPGMDTVGQRQDTRSGTARRRTGPEQLSRTGGA
ncbi:hypothetical protein OG230_33875 [Streptomyces sp. NBC_00234]|uniref:hypothetical protein n=1 Tax=Streptomyces sp. NBC_00234 TaxID=2903638 RepID=UPI002E2D1769|nr:hypothetical protein [Streptomyces sp. NBC_00234]